jgi:hypothetical protein
MPSLTSNSWFDPDVTLESIQEGNRVVRWNEFWARGYLGEDVEKYAPYLRVLVSIWQTKEDTEGGSAEEIVAHALGAGERYEPGKWSARLTVLDGKEFKPGFPATGLAHAVGNNGIPAGFDTYTWTRRLKIEDNILLVQRPQP